MRKISLFVLVLFASILLVGCGSKGEPKILTCTLDRNITSEAKLSSVYKVSYTDRYVNSIQTIETITSDSDSMLSTYKEQFDKVYANYRKIKGYNNSIRKEDNKLISTTDIDYQTINMDELIEIDSSIASFLEDGKLKVSDIKTAYEASGATCK